MNINMVIGIDASRANNPQKTGVGWYAYHVIEELKTIIPSSTSVMLYTDKPLTGDLANLPDNWTQKVLTWPPRRLWTHVRLSFEILMHKPDVLWIPAHVPPIIHPRHTIMTVHDVAALQFPKSYSSFERWYTLWSAKYALKKLAHIIVPSNFTKRELIGLPGAHHLSPITVVHHGFDSAYTKKSVSAIVAPDKPYILSIGRLEQKKNTVRIIQAFNKVKKQPSANTYQLMLIGKPGHGFEHVQKEIENSPYKSDIIHPGWVAQTELPSLMANAEMFVFPSVYEGFGIPILEACASGTPVITSKGLSTQEVGGDAALYVDPQKVDDIANAMIELITNQNTRDTLIKKGKKRATEFSWKTCATETYGVIVDTKKT